MGGNANGGISMSELTEKDVVLVLLAKCENNALNGITRIEKLAYLLTLSPSFPTLGQRLEFRPLHYGPYSDRVAEAVEVLRENDFIGSERLSFERQVVNRADEISLEEMSDTKEFIETKSYRLTRKGQIIAEHLYGQLSSQQRGEIDRIAGKFAQLNLKELMKRVYAEAPEEMLRKSTIREEMMCH